MDSSVGAEAASSQSVAADGLDLSNTGEDFAKLFNKNSAIEKKL